MAECGSRRNISSCFQNDIWHLLIAILNSFTQFVPIKEPNYVWRNYRYLNNSGQRNTKIQYKLMNYKVVRHTCEKSKIQLVLISVTFIKSFGLCWDVSFFFFEVCGEGTFGPRCQYDCDSCMRGGICNDENNGCICPSGWTGLLCNESEYALRQGTFAQLQWH